MSIYSRKVVVKGTDSLNSTGKFNISTHFMNNHKNLIGLGILIVLTAAIWNGVKYYNNVNAMSLSEGLYFNLNFGNSDAKNSDISQSKLDKAKKSLSESDNKFGYSGSIRLADIFYQKGQYDDALKEYGRIVKKTESSLLKIIGAIGIGSSYEAKGEYDKAILEFTNLSQTIDVTSSNGPYKLIAEMSIGRCLEGQGNMEKAVKQYQAVKGLFPDSDMTNKIDEKIESLSKL